MTARPRAGHRRAGRPPWQLPRLDRVFGPATPAVWRGLFAAALGGLWFAVLAPHAAVWLERFRPEQRGQRTAQDTVASGAARSAEARALLTEAQALQRREDDWGYIVASLLSTAERNEGLARASVASPIFARPGQTIEPEMPVLVEAILARYGPRTAAGPVVERRETWPMVDRRTRARVLVALVEGPGLDPERAAIILGATLRLLEAQARRVELEEALADL